MNNLIKDSWDILKNNPNLYNAPIFIWFISSLLSPDFSVSIYYFISIATIGSINMAITAGWYNQIKVNIATKEKSTLDDLLAGVGKYFNVILSGNVVLFILLCTSFIGVYSIGEYFININDSQLKDFQKIGNELAKMTPEQVTQYMKNVHPEIISIAYKWLMVFVTYATLAALFYFFISLWTQIAVFTGTNWISSWKESFSIVRKNLKIFTALTFIQAWFYILFIVVNLLVNDSFIQLMMIIISIVLEAYFAVLFCLFVFKFNDNKKIELLKDDLQSTVPKVQRPDNKK